MRSTFKRNPDRVLKDLILTEGGQYVTRSGCRIHSPVRCVDRGLTIIGVRNYVFGQMAIILDNGDYAYSNAITRVEIDPTSTTMVTIDDKEYYEFYFEPGSVVIKTNQVVMDDKILFFVLDEFVFQAKTPWYMSYNDRLNLFLNVQRYVGIRAADAPEIVELMVSITARSPSDDSIFIRQVAKTYDDTKDIINIPFASVQDSVQGTVDKIGGNYFEPALTGALVTPSRRANRVERILRAP